MSKTKPASRLKNALIAEYSKKQRAVSLIISLIFSLLVIMGISYNLLLSAESFEFNPLSAVDNEIVDGFFMRRLSSGRGLLQLMGTDASNLVLVDIDDESLDQMNLTWPVPRSIYARIIEKLQTAGARTIGFDIVMPDASIPEEDEILADTLEKTDNVFLAEFFYMEGGYDHRDIPDEDRLRVSKPYEPFTRAVQKDGRHRLGYVSIRAEKVIRRVDLGREVQGQERYLLSPLLCAHYMGMSPNEMKNRPEEGVFLMGDMSIPTSQGYARVNYFFPPGDFSQRFDIRTSIGEVINEFSLKNLLEDMDDKSLEMAFRDRLVLVGPTASGAGDIKATPFGQIPGVYIHANIIMSILSGNFLKPSPPLNNMLLMLIIGIIVGIIIPRLTPVAGAIFTGLFSLGYYNYSYSSFIESGTINFISAPVLVAVLGYLSINVYHHISETRARKGMSKMMREFAPIPIELIEEYLEKYGGSAATGGELAHVTVLFADIRGYTQMSEGMSSQEVMMTLNEYHQAMGRIFEETGGVIFTYIGDAQLVVYGLDEKSRVNHAATAIKAGLMMQNKMQDIRERLEQRGKYPFEVGIGICTGSLSIGVVGSSQLKQYTVIGDTVNVASRIQGMSRELNSPVLIHERTYLMARESIDSDQLPPVKLKGKQELVNVFRAKAVREIIPYPGDEIKDLDREVEALHEEIRIQLEQRRKSREKQEEEIRDKPRQQDLSGDDESLPAGVRRKTRRSRQIADANDGNDGNNEENSDSARGNMNLPENKNNDNSGGSQDKP